MADENRQFDQQVHDAFERIELSDDAQERILANLLAAQETRLSGGDQRQGIPLEESRKEAVVQEMAERVERFEIPSDADDGKAAEEQADAIEGAVVPFNRRRFGWRMLLPLAAVLAVAVVVVQATNLSGGGKATSEAVVAPQSVASSESKEYADAVAEDAGSADEAEALGVENSAQTMGQSDSVALDAAEEGPLATEEAAALTSVDYYPCVMLEDGTRLTALRDGLYTEEVSSDEVGELVGKAVASSFDDPQDESAVPCTVYALKHENGAYAVQYESETTYWRCEPIE